MHFLSSTRRRSLGPALLLTLGVLSAGCSDDPADRYHELLDVTFAVDRFVAVGGEQTPAEASRAIIMSSTDGDSWQRHDQGLPQTLLTGVAHGNGVFVAVGGE